MACGTIFRSAVSDADGTVDAGYLALFWTMAVTVSAIPFLLVLCAVACYRVPERAGEILQATGIAIGAICTGAGVVIGAVGAFRMGDKPRMPATTTRTETVTSATRVDAPLQVAVVDVPKPEPRKRRRG